MNSRFDRNEQLFGRRGQHAIRQIAVAIVGAGGLGCHVAQQSTYLGVRNLSLIDSDVVDFTSLNRLVGACESDVDAYKVAVVARAASAVAPDVTVTPIAKTLLASESLRALRRVDAVFGCVDNDGARLVLTEICSALDTPYVDLATDVDGLRYGGRVFVNWDGRGCLACMELLDLKEVQETFETPEQRKDRRAIYGVSEEALAGGGPSVVSLNGAIASLGVTEFMVGVTGLRRPQRLLNYYAHVGKVTASADEPPTDCYYCVGLRGEVSASRFLSMCA
jgi:molybdopterin/thiamine biosynthesis adenylyltransferase